MTNAEFRILRDQFALNGYYERWSILNEQKKALEQEIAEFNAKIAAAPKRDQKLIETEKVKVWWKLQDVIGQMAMIETDAPIRKERLGIK